MCQIRAVFTHTDISLCATLTLCASGLLRLLLTINNVWGERLRNKSKYSQEYLRLSYGTTTSRLWAGDESSGPGDEWSGNELARGRSAMYPKNHFKSVTSITSVLPNHGIWPIPILQCIIGIPIKKKKSNWLSYCLAFQISKYHSSVLLSDYFPTGDVLASVLKWVKSSSWI